MEDNAEWEPNILPEIQDAWSVTFQYLIATSKMKWNIKRNFQTIETTPAEYSYKYTEAASMPWQEHFVTSV